MRSQIALVPQDIFLFGGTIKENIAYGKKDADDKAILEAAQKAHVMEFVDRFPEKLETVVGERGTQLSGGQRQRIGIARTIALQPKLIVCDESVSALDISVQAQVLNLLNMLKETFGFTYIFISHDLAVVKYMSDQLLVMSKGKIEELDDADVIYASPKTVYTKKLIDAIPKGL